MTLPCPTPHCDRVMPGHLLVCRACTAHLLRDLADIPSLGIAQGAAAFVLGQDALAVLDEHGYAVTEKPQVAEMPPAETRHPYTSEGER